MEKQDLFQRMSNMERQRLVLKVIRQGTLVAGKIQTVNAQLKNRPVNT